MDSVSVIGYDLRDGDMVPMLSAVNHGIATDLMPRPLYLIAPRLARPTGPAFDTAEQIAEYAGAMGFAVTTYADISFAGPAEPRALAVVPYFTEADHEGNVARPGAGQESRSSGRWPLFSAVAGVARSYHLRDGLLALLTLSFSPRAQAFVVESARALLHLFNSIGALWRAVLAIPRFIVELPRAARTLMSGPPVSVEPFSPLAVQLAALLDETAVDGPAVVVILSDDPSDLDRMMDTELLAESGAAAIKVVFLADAWNGMNLDPRIDPVTLGARLASSALASGLDIYVDAPAARERLGRVLGRDPWPLSRLESDLAAAVAEPDPVERTARPLAVVIRPQWLFCGSNMVFSNQIEYLAERGYYVLEIIVNDLFLARSTPEGLTDHVLTNYRGSMAHRTILLNMKVGLLPWFQLLRQYGRRLFQSSLVMRTACLETAEVPDSLGRALARRRADIVVVNHCFNMKFARKLFPDSPLILESHDIQAEQSRLRSAVAGGSMEGFDIAGARADELDLMHAASWVVSLNEDETRYFEDSGKVAGVTTIHPYLADHSADRFNGQVNPDAASDLAAADPIAVTEPIDVLLVSSQHAANIISMNWFLDNVFKPFLGYERVRVTIVGNIAEACSMTHPNLQFTGQVPDIGPYDEAAKVVALPVTAGAGIPIKTLEALALGKAVVATSDALRGLSNGSARELPAFDDAGAFAEEICRLIADPTAREERIRAGREVAAHAYSRSAYFEGWDSVIERFSPPTAGPRPAA